MKHHKSERSGASAASRAVRATLDAVTLNARVTLGALPSSYDVGDKAEDLWAIEVKAF